MVKSEPETFEEFEDMLRKPLQVKELKNLSRENQEELVR
jgi:hypothetical protein